MGGQSVEFYWTTFTLKINVGDYWGHLFNTCHYVALKMHGDRHILFTKIQSSDCLRK